MRNEKEMRDDSNFDTAELLARLKAELGTPSQEVPASEDEQKAADDAVNAGGAMLGGTDDDIDALLRRVLPEEMVVVTESGDTETEIDLVVEIGAETAPEEPETAEVVVPEETFEEAFEAIVAESEEALEEISEETSEEEAVEVEESSEEVFEELPEDDPAEDEPEVTPYTAPMDELFAAAEPEADEAAPENEGEHIRGAEEIDSTDLNIILAMGLDDQYKDEMGDKLEEAQAEIEKTVMLQSGFGEFEYSEKSQTQDIMGRFNASCLAAKFKLIGASIFALILFFYENISLFGGRISGVLDAERFPVVHAMVALQLLFFVAAFAYKNLFDGLRGILRGRFVPDSFLCIGVAFATVQTVVECCMVKGGSPVRTYHFALALVIVLSLLLHWLTEKTNKRVFSLLASNGSKYVLSKLGASDSEFEVDAFRDSLEEDEVPTVIRAGKTSFVEDFFKRTNRPSEAARPSTVFIPLALAVAVAVLVLTVVLGGNAADGFAYGFAALMLAMPATVFFMYSYPFYRANKLALDDESAMVGNAAVDEYCNASILSFDDVNVFLSYNVKVQSINVYGDNRIDRVVYYSSSLFGAVGGPLSDVFELVTMELGRSDDVKLIGRVHGCLEADVDGHRIVAGKLAHLEEHGFTIHPQITAEDAQVDPGISIMYIMIDGAIAAKMFIRYSIDPDFEYILKSLYRSGMCIGVKTFDPNIDDALLARMVNTKKYPVRVVHYGSELDLVRPTERASGGIVSKASTKDALQTLILCDKVHQSRQTNLAVKVLSMLAGAVIVLLLTLFGKMGTLGSAMIAAYQLLWMIPSYLITRFYLNG